MVEKYKHPKYFAKISDFSGFLFFVTIIIEKNIILLKL